MNKADQQNKQFYNNDIMYKVEAKKNYIYST